MRRHRPPYVKICCIQSVAEARAAIAHGADALGLVAAMPSGPGCISDEQVAEIAAAVPPPVATWMLTSETDAEAIIEHQRRCRTGTVQMVDALARGSYRDLRRALPGIRLVQVIHVAGDRSVAEAAAAAGEVDALLLDSGDPGLPVKELGGTGRVHDWAISGRIVETCGKPVFLAGGLRADNVARACAEVRPHGVDLCSGVRTDDVLDEGKLAEFFAAVRSIR